MDIFRKKMIVGVLLIACLLTFCILMANGQQKNADTSAEPQQASEVVRVGIVESHGYAERDSNGYERGFDAEYVYKLAQYADLKLQFVAEPDYAVMLNDLEQGRLDMAVGVSHTPERDRRFIFTENWLGRGYMRLSVRYDDDRFEYGNIDQLHGKRFGILRGSSMVPALRSWASQHGFAADVIEYGTERETKDALNSGAVDVWVTGGDQSGEYKLVMMFSPTAYYVVFPRGGMHLKNRMDSAMMRLKAENPLYEDTLYQKYRRGNQRTMAAFTKTEKEYIATHPSIKVAVLRDDAPYSYVSDDGQVQGIISAYYEALSAASGLNFVFVAYDDYESVLAAVKNGTVDVAGMLREDVIVATRQGILLTSEYTTQNVVKITHRDTQNIVSAAVKHTDANALEQQVNMTQSGIAMQRCRNVEECYQLFYQGDTDAIICGLPTAMWIMNHYRSANFTMANMPSVQLNFCGGVAQGNGVLGSILSKAAVASRFQVDSIIAGNILPENNLQTFVNRLPLFWIAAFFLMVLLLLVAAAIVAFHIYRQRERLRLAAVQAEQQAAEQARKAESSFLSSMSHDMRTPLNGIIGFAELALEDTDAVQRQNCLEKISASGKLMLALVNDVLDISRIESGKLVLHQEIFVVQELVDSIIATISMLAAKKHIKLVTTCHGLADGFVLADRLRLQQVLLNLLSNAVKYTQQGGNVHCELRLQAEGEQKYLLFIRISDNGIGMSEKFQKKMFDPFSQEQRVGDLQGTGLGLCIVKRIVELMGGSIEVESRINKGSVFTVQLQLPAVYGAAVSTAENDVAGDFDLSGYRLLVCEDNSINAELISLLLEKHGAELQLATDGQKGVELFRASTAGYFTAVLMDLRMPVMDGFTAAREIRCSAHPDAEHIPIIAFTADAYNEDIEKCRAVGMDGHIAKPLVPAELFHVLSRICGRPTNGD